MSAAARQGRFGLERHAHAASVCESVPSIDGAWQAPGIGSQAIAVLPRSRTHAQGALLFAAAQPQAMRGSTGPVFRPTQ